MKNIVIYKLIAGIALLCALAAAWEIYRDGIAHAGPFIIAFFIMLSVACRGWELLKGFTYTLIIFAAVTAALYYPQYFVEVKGFKLSGLITPLLMKLLGGAFIKIDTLGMMWDITKIVVLPIGAGILFNKYLLKRAAWLETLMPIISMFGIAFIIVIITAAGRNSLLNIGAMLVLLVLIHNLLGYTLGYWAGRLFKMPERDCRTMAIEVGMQNAGLASGLAKAMGKIATVGLAPAVFGPLMNVTGSLLANYWHRKPLEKNSIK